MFLTTVNAGYLAVGCQLGRRQTRSNAAVSRSIIRGWYHCLTTYCGPGRCTLKIHINFDVLRVDISVKSLFLSFRISHSRKRGAANYNCSTKATSNFSVSILLFCREFYQISNDVYRTCMLVFDPIMVFNEKVKFPVLSYAKSD